MIVQLGKRDSSDDIVDLLLECHHRIRRFVALAATLAAAPKGDVGEIRSTAEQVRRYFVESLPEHVIDEEQVVAPRLEGVSGEITRALTSMTAEHGTHAPLVATLVALCERLVARPEDLGVVSSDLALIAAALDREFTAHLDLEERVVIPALRSLPLPRRREMFAAVRERRTRQLGESAQAVRDPASGGAGSA